jgi:radical SAM superfamily enzyme YgiQ (UPF0313 family)
MNLAVRLLYHLNKHKHDIAYQEFSIKEQLPYIVEKCVAYEVLAFSCYIWNITQTLALVKLIKAIKPDIKILLGGPEVSYEWEKIIALAEIDYIITGEGEIPFGRFLDAFPNVDLIPNLVYKKDGEVKYLPQSCMFDLNQYQYINPYEADDTDNLKNKVCYIETSRGCPYKCEFCLASLDNKVRYLPDAAIKQNLLHLIRHGRVIKFLDRTFNVKKDFTIDMFKFILENHQAGNVYQFEITADIVHPDIIKFIDEHVPPGIFRFEIGIQTVNQKANLEVSRKQNFEKTKKVIQQLQHKIEMHLDLIVGLPFDYMEDIKFSFKEVFKLFPAELQLGFLKFLKGTPVRDKHNAHGYKFESEPPYQLIESIYLSRAELHEITLLEEALEIYWNKKRACNTLKYVCMQYSIFDFLRGLAICFVQKNDFHHHSLNDVYQRLKDYAENAFPKDSKLKQLIAIDFYLAYQSRPRKLLMFNTGSTPTESMNTAGNQQGKGAKYVSFDIDFDFLHFSQKHEIIEGNHQLIIKYSGKGSPEIIC